MLTPQEFHDRLAGLDINGWRKFYILKPSVSQTSTQSYQGVPIEMDKTMPGGPWPRSLLSKEHY